MDTIELINSLETLPSEILNYLNEAEDLREEWKLDCLLLSSSEAKKALLIKAEDPKLTATEIKWRVNADDDIYGLQMENIKREANYRRKEKEAESLQEKLNSLKVIARLQQIGG